MNWITRNLTMGWLPTYPINFDIDNYINPIIPRNRLHLLPKPISWILGYRNAAPLRIGNVLVWWWAFIGAFAGLLVVEAVFQTKHLQAEGTPIVIASLVRPPSSPILEMAVRLMEVQ